MWSETIVLSIKDHTHCSVWCFLRIGWGWRLPSQHLADVGFWIWTPKFAYGNKKLHSRSSTTGKSLPLYLITLVLRKQKGMHG